MKKLTKFWGGIKGSTKFWIGLALILVGSYLLIIGIPSYAISFYQKESGNYYEPEEIAQRDYLLWGGVINPISPIIILIGIILMIKGEIQKREESKLE
jgi:hypothetical protein